MAACSQQFQAISGFNTFILCALLPTINKVCLVKPLSITLKRLFGALFSPLLFVPSVAWNSPLPCDWTAAHCMHKATCPLVFAPSARKKNSSRGRLEHNTRSFEPYVFGLQSKWRFKHSRIFNNLIQPLLALVFSAQDQTVCVFGSSRHVHWLAGKKATSC